MKVFLTFFILLATISIGIGWMYAPNEPENSELKTAKTISAERPIGGDFELDSANGKIKLSDFNGKLVLIYFGYTFCPDICPTNLGNVSIAYQGLTPKQRDNLQVLFISVDPERDTPERLQQYANYFDIGMIGLTGNPSVIAEVARRYGVIYAIHKQTPNDVHYAVDHSAFSYVVSPSGKLLTQLPHATGPDLFIEAIKTYSNFN